MSEIFRAQVSILETLERVEAEANPASDAVQKSLLSISDTDFGLGFGKLQHAISEELMKYHTAARKLPVNDRRCMAFLDRENLPFASQLLSGCLLPSFRFTSTLFQLAI